MVVQLGFELFSAIRRCMNTVSRVTISWFSSATLRTAASFSPAMVEYWFGFKSKEFATCIVLVRMVLPLCHLETLPEALGDWVDTNGAELFTGGSRFYICVKRSPPAAR
jgi:hypothetical protein